ncbi:MAG: biofilm development regulator YmgB/AriR family protein [Pantoea sp.]|nr:biofilm development regulator YmgB/AriR family protein [Pantoea sp.]
MNPIPGIETQIIDYFKQSEEKPNSHEMALRALMERIASKKKGRDEKKIIAGLLENIETEKDTVRLQIYRQALELLLRGDRC